jgi:hypothetical protein
VEAKAFFETLELEPWSISENAIQLHFYAIALKEFIADAIESTALLRDIDGDGAQEVIAVKGGSSGVSVSILDIENGRNLIVDHNFFDIESPFVYFAGTEIVCYDGQSNESHQDMISYNNGEITVDELSYAESYETGAIGRGSLNGEEITADRVEQILAEYKKTETIYMAYGDTGSGDIGYIFGSEDGYLSGFVDAMSTAQETYDQQTYLSMSMYINGLKQTIEYEDYQNFDIADYMSGPIEYNESLNVSFDKGYNESYDVRYSDFNSLLLPELLDVES